LGIKTRVGAAISHSWQNFPTSPRLLYLLLLFIFIT
jgi:hypothetical protein